jgi:anthranilate phosphoribosyltransferase
LAALGVNIEAPLDVVQHCLDELGICFCFAPLMHPAMKRVAEVRKRLAIPTIFNLLGPLCNPASAPYQLLGVGRAELRTRLAAALRLLGTRRTAVVCGEDGLDEVTLGGPTKVTIVENDSTAELTWNPADFGLTPAGWDELLVDSPASSAALIGRVLAGEPGPPRDVVVLNAAAALWTAGHASSLVELARLAGEAIDSGRARQLLARLIEVSRS